MWIHELVVDGLGLEDISWCFLSGGSWFVGKEYLVFRIVGSLWAGKEQGKRWEYETSGPTAACCSFPWLLIFTCWYVISGMPDMVMYHQINRHSWWLKRVEGMDHLYEPIGIRHRILLSTFIWFLVLLTVEALLISLWTGAAMSLLPKWLHWQNYEVWQLKYQYKYEC
jgi:hypothetical protein